MESYSCSLGKRHQNKLGHIAASVVGTLALAISINSANATPVKTTTAKEITPVSVQLNQTKPVIAQLQSNKPQYQAMQTVAWRNHPHCSGWWCDCFCPPVLWRIGGDW